MFGHFKPGDPKLQMQIAPKDIGVGDKATVVPELVYESDMISTPIGQWTITPEGLATIDSNGVITAVKSGDVKVTFKSGKITGDLDVKILPDSREVCVVTLKLTGKAPEGKVKLSISMTNNVPAVFDVEPDDSMSVKAKKNVFWKFTIIDGKNRTAISAKGVPVSRQLFFDRSKEFPIEIADWK